MRLWILLGLVLQFFCVSLFGFKNFYMGGSVGGAFLTGKQNGTAVGTLAINRYAQDLGGDIFASNWSGMLYGGFGFQKGFVYLGFEGFGQYSHRHLNNNRQNVSRFLDTQSPANDAEESAVDSNGLKVGPWQYGLDSRIGVFVNPLTLIYGRVGIGWTKLTLSTISANRGQLDSSTPFNFVLMELRKNRVALCVYGVVSNTVSLLFCL